MSGPAEPPRAADAGRAPRPRPRPKAASGEGYIEVLRDKNGYLTLRPRIHRAGQRYYGTAVGVRRGATKREQEANLRAARAQARANLAELRLALARGERPDPARARRSLGAQLDLWLEAKKGKVAANNWKSYESAIRLHVERYPLAHLPLGKLQGEDLDAWLGELRAAGVTSAMARYAFDRVIECLRALLTEVALAPADGRQRGWRPSPASPQAADTAFRPGRASAPARAPGHC